jgi:hypothetical protein
MCWLISFVDLICWLFSFAGLIDRLFSLSGRVNKEGLLKPVRLLDLSVVCCFGLVLSGPAMREVLLWPIRLLELLVDDLGVVETDGLLVLIGLPIREVLLWLTRLLEPLVDDFDAVETDGLLVLIGLLIRDVLLWLIRLLESLVDDFDTAETDGLLVLMGLAMREVLLWLIWLLELLVDDFDTAETDGLLVLMGLAMREVLLWLISLRVLVVGGFPTLELGAVDLLLLRELPEDLLTLEVVGGRETVDRLGVVLAGGLLRVTLLGWLTLGVEDILELLLVEGLEVLTLALLPDEDLEALTLVRELLVRGADAARLVPELEDREAVGAGELLAALRLPPLDLLLLERDVFAVAGPASNIRDKVRDNRITLRFFEFFRVNMVILLIKLIFFLLLFFTVSAIIKSKKHIKNAITGAFYCTATPLFHPLKALTICPVTVILHQNHAFFSILWELSDDL